MVLDKDVTAAAVAERWAGSAVGSSDFAFLYLGSGVGVGFVSDDIVVRGRSGNAGDIGHLIVDVNGPPCDCGQRGCLGTACSPLFLVREAVLAGIIPATSSDDDLIQSVRRVGSLCEAADEGDERAIDILQQSAMRIARAVTLIAGMLDTELVVCGGPAWAPAAHHYLPVIQAHVRERFELRAVHEVEVSGTALGASVTAIGAACLVLDERYAARPSSLLLA